MTMECNEPKGDDSSNAPAHSFDTAQAMQVMKEAMVKDSPSEKGSYAHSWHCNIAMMCFDAIGKELPDLPFEVAHKIGNDAATRFMKLCFEVDTKQ